MPGEHETERSRHREGSQVVASVPPVFRTRTPLRALPGTRPGPLALIFKPIRAFGSLTNRDFFAILRLTLARHQPVARIDDSASSIQPQALGAGGPGSTATLRTLDVDRTPRELAARGRCRRSERAPGRDVGPHGFDYWLKHRYRHASPRRPAAQRAAPPARIVVAEPDCHRNVVGEADEPRI